MSVKRLSTMWETWVRSLGREDSLEKAMATHSSILAWKIPWAEEPGGATVHAVTKSQTRVSTHTHKHTVTQVDPSSSNTCCSKVSYRVRETNVDKRVDSE